MNDPWSTVGQWSQQGQGFQQQPNNVAAKEASNSVEQVLNQQTIVDADNPMAKYDAMDQDQVLLVWDDLKKKLTAIKADEMTMRKYVVKRAFPNANEGTNKVPLGNGYELKAGVKFNYKISGTNDEVEAALDAIALKGNEGSFIASQIITWSAEFHESKYKELVEADEAGSIFAKEMLKEINKILTITDAAPTLEIKEPKKKK